MEDKPIDNHILKFTVRDAYYPETRMSWQSHVSLLYTELFSESPNLRSKGGAGIEADNIDQICFDLSEGYEIKYIECIGFRFPFDDQLIAPTPTRRGNLILSYPPILNDKGKALGHRCFIMYSLDRHLELTCTPDRTLLRIGIDTQPVTEVVAASAHVRYTLSGGALQEIWFVSPTVYDH